MANLYYSLSRKQLKKFYKLELTSWAAMKQRCYYKDHKQYHDYGGRGIRICVRWRHSYRQFLTDMGPKPTPDHVLDRKDNDGDYEPGNCRWITRTESNRNRRSRCYLTLNGRTMMAIEWAEETGLPIGTITDRLYSGWSHERILTTPANSDRKDCHMITYDGRTQPLFRWAKELGVRTGLILGRLSAGYSVEQALTTPPRKWVRSHKV